MIRTVVGMPKVLEEAHRGGGGPPWWGRPVLVEEAHRCGRMRGLPLWLEEFHCVWEDQCSKQRYVVASSIE